VGSGSSTGAFTNSGGTVQQVGQGVSGNNLYITENSIVIFSPGAGNYFNAENYITPIPASGVIPQNGRTQLYVTVTRLIGNGAQGTLSDGSGPITLSQNVPTDAQAITVIPAFSNSFSTTLIARIINLISSYSEFGIRYDQTTQSYAIIAAQDIDVTSEFSQTNEGSELGINNDSSWLLSFTLNSTTYTVQSRQLSYIFQSVSETKFYFDDSFKIFDSTTGLTVNDSVNVLKVNGDPDTAQPYTNNLLWYIYGQIAESDGWVDNSKALVTFSDTDDDGVPDNPDIFAEIVQPDVDPLEKFVYLQKTYGYESFVTYESLDKSLVNSGFTTEDAILPNINNYPLGQIFYATTEEQFYVLLVHRIVLL
jgi:hypothetical protein